MAENNAAPSEPATGKDLVVPVVCLFLLSCYTVCMASEDTVDDQCLNDGDCTEKTHTNEYSRPVPMDLAPETREVFHTIAVLEMYRAQREVANYMELAYLRLADHPEQAKEVRLTAHSARTQHLMTNGLMKKFTVTAAHIVKTLIPMILDAVVELQSADVVKEIFSQVIKIAEEMKNETETTQKRYIEIQTEVQKNMASVTERNKEVVDEQERIRVEMEREKQLAKAAKLAQEELDEEKKKMEEELDILKSNRDKLMKQAEGAAKMMNKADDAVFDSTSLTPGSALAGGIGGAALGIFSAGVNFLTGLFRSDKRQKHFEKLMQAYSESQNAVERVMGQKRDVMGRMHDQRKEALERLATLKKLGMQTANLGNVESLREAHAQLGNVDRQFTRIIEFWSNMAAVLKVLQDDSTSGSVYLAKLENPKFVERFKTSIERSEKGWKFFGRICSDYVQESDTQIYTLYNFLSAPIDSMAAAEREQRQKEVLLAIEADIENTYPKSE